MSDKVELPTHKRARLAEQQKDPASANLAGSFRVTPLQDQPAPPRPRKIKQLPRPHVNKPPDIQQKIPPHSVEAEMGVDSSIMHSPHQAIAECVAAGLQPHWFHVPALRTIYGELRDAWDSGAAIDLITFTNRLRDKGLLSEVGGAAAVTDVNLYLDKIFDFVPTAANLPHYIEIVRDCYVRRQIIREASGAIGRAYEPVPDTDVCGQLDQIISGATSLRSLQGAVGALSVRSPSEILAMPQDEYANLYADHVIAKGVATGMAGIGGLGKSRLVKQLLTAGIIGRPCFGMETHFRDATCLVIQTEDPISRLQYDLEHLKRWAGKDWKQIDEHLRIHTLEKDNDYEVSLDNPANIHRLEKLIGEIDPLLVVFDVLRDFGIGDLNTDTDMSATCNAIKRVGRTGNLERALIVLTHARTGKAGAAQAFGLERSGFARQSKMFMTAMRAVINVAPGSEENNELLILTCGKANLGKEFPPVAVRLDLDTMIYEVEPDFDIDGWREHLKGTKQQRTFSPDEIREIPWPASELEKKPLATLVMDEVGCGKSRAYELIKEAVRRQFVRFNKITRTYSKK